MEVLIQHNVRAGLGDYTNGMFRYFHLVDKMRENGFTKIGLYVNMKESTMFDKDFFFRLYNKSLFEKIFDEIIVSDVAITNPDYNELTFFYVNGERQIGFNQFDIFINQSTPIFEYFKNNLGLYFSDFIVPKFVNFFSDYVMDRYSQMNIHKNEQYKSLHFRAKDGRDNVDLYIDHEEEFKDIIFNKGKVFVCSNSYKFKEYIKSFNSPNVFMYELPFEQEFGNHLSGLPFNNEFGKDDYEERTIDAAVESLTISDSNEVFSFNFFGNVHSNFLNLAKWKSVNIKIVALKNGLNWVPSMG
jgi:hypothetical protein